jgi:hypothetical protein
LTASAIGTVAIDIREWTGWFHFRVFGIARSSMPMNQADNARTNGV